MPLTDGLPAVLHVFACPSDDCGWRALDDGIPRKGRATVYGTVR